MKAGDGVRYRGLGAGRITELLERKFQGERATFAVIFFPHKQMNAQVPIADEAVLQKVSPLLSQRKLNALLKQLQPNSDLAKTLPRTWDSREEWGKAKLVGGGPQDWMELLCSYALAESHGVEILASDQDLIEGALELIASELCCLRGGESRADYDDALGEVRERYRASAALREGAEGREAHFASVGATEISI